MSDQLQSSQPVPQLPWADYDAMTVRQVIAQGKAQNLDAAGRERVLAYERLNKNRKGVITAYVNWNS